MAHIALGGRETRMPARSERDLEATARAYRSPLRPAEPPGSSHPDGKNLATTPPRPADRPTAAQPELDPPQPLREPPPTPAAGRLEGLHRERNAPSVSAMPPSAAPLEERIVC